MKKIKLFSTLIVSTALLCISNIAMAQTSVYVCSTNGSYGYSYGTKDVSTYAYNKCVEYGGKTPYSILSVSSKGYGAIAVGKDTDGHPIVGAAAGHKNQGDAQNIAKQECSSRGGQNPYIAETFHDE